MTGVFSRRLNLLKIKNIKNELIKIENRHMFKFWNLNKKNNKYIIVVRNPKEVIISGYLYHKRCDEEWVKKNINYYDDWLKKKYFNNNIIEKNKKLIEDSYFSNGEKSYQEILNNLKQDEGIKYEMDHAGKNTLLGMYDFSYYDCDNVLIVKFEDLVYNLNTVIKNVFNFLEIEDNEGLEKFYSKAKISNLLTLKRKKRLPSHVTNIKLKKDRYKEYWNKELDNYFYQIYPKDIMTKFKYID